MLRNFKPRTATMQAGDETVALRGLTVNDLSLLMESHASSLRAVWDHWNGAKDAPTDGARQDRMLVLLLREFPALSADVIAIAANEPDAGEQARRLPFPTQLDALVKIARLTFEEVGGLGNFLSSLTVAASGLGLAPSSGGDKTSPALSLVPTVTP